MFLRIGPWPSLAFREIGKTLPGFYSLKAVYMMMSFEVHKIRQKVKLNLLSHSKLDEKII